jgi:hypothetical protein
VLQSIPKVGNLNLRFQQMGELFILLVIEKGDKVEEIFGLVIGKKMIRGERLKI